MSVTEQLVEFLQKPVTVQDRSRAALLLLDWTGCAVAGQREPTGQKLSAALPDETGTCTRVGASFASPLMAALHNGCLGNVLEMDDVDRQAVLHAGPVVIPAALAMAEYVGASGEDVLDSLVKGYEATIRMGRAVGAGHYAYWHNTATCGPFGAAIAACHLLEGSDSVSALGLAGTQAAGLWQTRHEPESDAKQLHAGHAAHAGVLAALLSRQGFAGPRTILEGEQGFFAAMCVGADAQHVLADYGPDWLIHQTSLKPYPACRHTHPAIDAALAIRDIWGHKTGQTVHVKTYKDALKFCDRPDPHSLIEAKFSLQHAVALALLRGGVTDPVVFEDSLTDSQVQALRADINVSECPELTAHYPAHYGARILAGGQEACVQDCLGDPEKPMSDSDIIAKAKTLMGPNAQAEAVCEAALAIGENPKGLQTYMKALPCMT